MPYFDVAIEGVNCRVSLSSLWKIPSLALLKFTFETSFLGGDLAW